MFNHSHIRHFSSVFVSLRDFRLISTEIQAKILRAGSPDVFISMVRTLFRVHSRCFITSQ